MNSSDATPDNSPPSSPRLSLPPPKGNRQAASRPRKPQAPKDLVVKFPVPKEMAVKEKAPAVTKPRSASTAQPRNRLPKDRPVGDRDHQGRPMVENPLFEKPLFSFAEKPVYVLPENPLYVPPENPLYVHSQRPLYVQPQKPHSGHPQKPLSGHPQNPLSGHPQKPLSGHPQKPLSVHSQKPISERSFVIKLPKRPVPIARPVERLVERPLNLEIQSVDKTLFERPLFDNPLVLKFPIPKKAKEKVPNPVVAFAAPKHPKKKRKEEPVPSVRKESLKSAPDFALLEHQRNLQAAQNRLENLIEETSVMVDALQTEEDEARNLVEEKEKLLDELLVWEGLVSSDLLFPPSKAMPQAKKAKRKR